MQEGQKFFMLIREIALCTGLSCCDFPFIDCKSSALLAVLCRLHLHYRLHWKLPRARRVRGATCSFNKLKNCSPNMALGVPSDVLCFLSRYFCCCCCISAGCGGISTIPSKRSVYKRLLPHGFGWWSLVKVSPRNRYYPPPQGPYPDMDISVDRWNYWSGSALLFMFLLIRVGSFMSCQRVRVCVLILPAKCLFLSCWEFGLVWMSDIWRVPFRPSTKCSCFGDCFVYIVYCWVYMSMYFFAWSLYYY